MSLSDRYAIAVDLGTTTIAASLIECATGRRLALAGALNPQRSRGADVVARLEYASRSDDLRRELTGLVNRELERLSTELAASAGVPVAAVGSLAIAGNPTMTHLLLDLPITTLVRPPYRPTITSGHRVTTRQLGWEADLPAYIFPSPGGFVGGDLVAFLYSQALGASRPEPDAVRLYLDLGTNGEIALAAGDQLFATSAAAGPAFEGGNLACGMAALPGAISDVQLDGERLVVQTIGDSQPVGICGSGVLTTIALLRRVGMIDASGRLLPPDEVASNLANRLEERAGQWELVLYRDASRRVVLTQQDIRQVQLAKAAVAAGIDVLLTRARIRREEVQDVVLTGSFGAALSPGSLKSIGIFTESMVKIARFVREGALAGVEGVLCSAHAVAEVEQLATALKVIPLSGTPAFERNFLTQMDFPEA